MARRKILLIDGDETFRRETTFALGLKGFEIVEGTTSTEALDLAAKIRPTIMVVSVELTPSNGWLVCTRMKKDSDLHVIPVLLMSASATPEIIERHKKLRTRADDYLRKPFTVEELARVIDRLVPPTADSVTDEQAAADLAQSETHSDAKRPVTAKEPTAASQQTYPDGALRRPPGSDGALAKNLEIAAPSAGRRDGPVHTLPDVLAGDSASGDEALSIAAANADDSAYEVVESNLDDDEAAQLYEGLDDLGDLGDDEAAASEDDGTGQEGSEDGSIGEDVSDREAEEAVSVVEAQLVHDDHESTEGHEPDHEVHETGETDDADDVSMQDEHEAVDLEEPGAEVVDEPQHHPEAGLGTRPAPSRDEPRPSAKPDFLDYRINEVERLKDIERLHREIGERDRQLAALRRELEDKPRKTKDVEETTGRREIAGRDSPSDLLERIKSLQDVVDARDAAAAGLESRILELEADLEGYRQTEVDRDQETERLRSLIGREGQEALELRKLVNDRDRTIEGLKASEMKLQADLSKARDENTRREAAIKSLSAKAEKLVERALRLESERTALREEARSVGKEAELLRERVDQLTNEIDQAVARESTLSFELAGLRDENVKLKDEIMQSQEAAPVIQAELATAQAAHSATTAEADDLRNHRATLEADLQAAKSELDALWTDHELELSRLEKAQADNAELVARLEAAEAQVALSGTRLQAAEDVLVAARDSFDKLLGELAPPMEETAEEVAPAA